jgi:hypothetical protein
MTLFILIAGLLLALLLYTRVRNLPLYLLRALAIALVLVFATDFVVTSFGGGQNHYQVLLDGSRSMSVSGKDEWARSRIREIAQEREMKVEFLSFHGAVEPFEPGQETFEGDMTDLARTLRSADRSPALLLTDGLHNVPENPLRAAEARTNPVYVLLPRDLFVEPNAWIDELEADRVILRGGNARIQAEIRVQGEEGYQGTLALRQGGTDIDRRSVSLAPGTSSIVSFEVSPEGLGAHDYRIQLSRMPGEDLLEDNVREVRVEVIAGLYQGVLFATRPSPEIGAIRRLVSRYPRLDIRFVVRDPAGNWTEWGSPVRPYVGGDMRADFAVLVDPDPEALGMAREACRDKDRLLIFLGDHSETVARELGLDVRSPATIKKEVSLSPTPYLLELISEPVLGPLSPQRGAVLVDPPPGAIPLLVTPSIPSDRGPYPILSMIRGKGIEMFLASGLGFFELSLYDPEAYAKLVGGLLTYFMRQHNEFICELEKQVFFSGEPVTIQAYAYDESGEPLEDVYVEIPLEADVQPLRYQAPGRFESAPLFFEPGEQEVLVRFRRGSTEMAERTVRFKVIPGNLETQETGMDTVLLREIALASGGRVLEGPEEFFEVETRRVRTSSSFRPNAMPWVLLLFIALLTIEGWIRKRRGLL